MRKNIDDIPPAKNSFAGVPPETSFINEEWLRLPKPGSRLEGLSRTSITELVVPCGANGYKPPVRSVLLKKRGAARGIRLIEKRSFFAYLNHLADEQACLTGTMDTTREASE